MVVVVEEIATSFPDLNFDLMGFCLMEGLLVMVVKRVSSFLWLE